MKIKILTAILLGLIVALPGMGQIIEFPPSVPLELHKPLDAETRQLQRKASVLENRSENAKALEIYLQLFREYPEYTPFYEGVVRNFFATERYSEGLAFVDSLRRAMFGDTNPENLTFSERDRLGSLIVDGGRFCGRLRRREAAFQRWDELYKLPHISNTPFFRLLNALIDCRYLDGLEDMAARARKLTGNPSLLAASLASFWANRGQVERAVAEWILLMKFQPRQVENIKRQILALPEDEQTQSQIEASLKAAQSQKAVKRPVTELLASLYFRNRQWDKAYEQIKIADQIAGSTGEKLLTFAETLSSERQSGLALKVLADLAETNQRLSVSPRALLIKAESSEAEGAYQFADSIYGILTSGPALSTAQGQTALLRQAKMRLKQLHQPARARALLQAGLKRNPSLRLYAQAVLLIGDTYLAERKLPQARDTYMQVASGRYSPASDVRSRALVNAAQADVYLGEIDQAMERLHSASQEDPDGMLTNDALDMLEMLRNGKPDSAGLRLLTEADWEMQWGQRAMAESLYVLASQKARVDDLVERALWKLSELKLASGRAQDAIAVLEQSLSRFPRSLRSPEVLLKIGSIYEDTLEDGDSAVKTYERILLEYPQSLQVEEARARIRKLESSQT